jgi:putative heme-binding domain-containing protein
VSGQYDEGLFRITPPAAGGDVSETLIEKINVNLSGAQGLCWSFGRLYALVTKNGATPSGLYRVHDRNGDDTLDTIELLCPLGGGGDHGWHAVLPAPDGRSLYVIAGNNTLVPPLASSRVPPHWSEDHLLPRMADAGGHMKGVLAPGGVVYRVSQDGQKWEMIANGFRNIYDAAFNREGELFTYDADMEWDMGTPWYRPTRICHVTSGAEFGWRNGSGKWPAYLPDSLPGILEMGPGSPTGVTFGYGARFPKRYRDALFAADWTFGRIYAVHLGPAGGSYKGEAEVFLSGVPLPVTDMVVNPLDGALYFITGGWRIQTGLYRVVYERAESVDSEVINASTSPLHEERRKVEALHGPDKKAALDVIWPYLGHEDRTLRFAARVALEWTGPSAWRERALTETNHATALNALLALTRVSSRDEFHRKPSDAAPDKELQARVLAALDRIDRSSLTLSEQTDLLRCYAVSFTRFGPPDEPRRTALLARFEPWFPQKSRALNSQLCEVLVYLQSPRVAAIALELVRNSPTQEEQLDYIKSLRVLEAGWTPGLRREYFGWFHKAACYTGGASFRGFLRMIKEEALATLPDAERDAWGDLLNRPAPSGDDSIEVLAGREQTNWVTDAFGDALDTEWTARNFDRGRKMFSAAGCFQCHSIAGEGGAVGPDLTRAAGRFSKRDLLEAILDPNKTISDLYQNMVITTRDGEVVTGRIVYHMHNDAVSVNPNMQDPATTITVNRNDVLSIAASRTSPMPEGLLASLEREEILDLLAYILSGGDATHAMFTREKVAAISPRDNK